MQDKVINNVSSTIDLSVLASFSEKDLDVLKKIGITLPTPKVKKEREKPTKNPVTLARKLSTRHTAPAEYYVMNTLVCDCCQHSEVMKGKMKQMDPSERFLRFNAEDIPENAPFRSRRLHRINCPHCQERLMGLSKEELVLRVMRLTDINARKPTFKET